MEGCGLSNWNNGSDIFEIVENVERSPLVEIREDQKFNFGHIKFEMLIRYLSEDYVNSWLHEVKVMVRNGDIIWGIIAIQELSELWF